MENVTIINKDNHFKVYHNKQKIELLSTTQEFKLSLIKDKKLFLSTSKGQLKHLNSLLKEGKAKDVERTNGVIQSIGIRIANLKNEIGIIRNAAVIDGHKLPNIIEDDSHQSVILQSEDNKQYFIPIGIKHDLSPIQQLNQFIADNEQVFKDKVDEIFTTNSSEMIVPILREYAKQFGYKLIKSSK